jgi:3-keto-disaccharide hydrolase
MIPRSQRAFGLAALVLTLPGSALAQRRSWPPNSPDRPRPPVITPGPAGAPAAAPSDAIVLFDGTDLANWMGADSSAAAWRVEHGAVEIVPGAGTLQSRRAFGSVQLHIEWAAPTPAEGEGQERGNSGVYLMSHYEIQVLDSYQNPTYADGQAGAVYGQTPPLANAARPPGAWQTYDIVFHRPIFAADGSVRRPARVTVIWNGVLVQDDTEITGWTVHQAVARYRPHADRLPLMLQDHGTRVRYRNIWVREIEDGEGR